MKLHDLKPAPGSRTPKRRVGRGIAAGQGKTAGRGTKGAKARAGGKIPAWFEGGQTPLHQRIPKLRGFRNPFKIQYEVVNVGDIGRLVELGVLESGEMPGATKQGSKQGSAPMTVNQEILRAAGLVRRLDRPMKVLGAGELSTALFVVADAFSSSARAKIEGAGGTVSVLEVPATKRTALGVADDAASEAPADEGGEETKPARAKRGAAKAVPEAAAPDEAASALTPDEAAAVEAALAESAMAAADSPADAPATADAATAEAAADTGEAVAEEAPAKPRASRKPKTPKPDADA